MILTIHNKKDILILLKILINFTLINIVVILEILLYEFICSSKVGKTRQDINDSIYLLMTGTIEYKNSKVRTALTYLKNQSLIENVGSDTRPIWKIVNFTKLCRVLFFDTQ